jgi:phosphoenolpyruvate synthase/pyruvate phosphate dikinase
MFFASADRIRAMRELIGAAELAREGEKEEGGEHEEGRKENGGVEEEAAAAKRAAASASALAALKAYQRDDFAGIFREMRGSPVVIRTLDPPLHEFLPAEGPALDELVESLSKLLAVSREVRDEREREREFFSFFEAVFFFNSEKTQTKKTALLFLPSPFSLNENKRK